MSNRHRLAQRLMMEQRQREQGDFATPVPRRAKFDADEEDGGVLIGMAERDIEIEHFLCPSVDDQLGRPGSSLTGYSIMEEISTTRTGPHVEGTPIGQYVKRKPWKPTQEIHPRGHYKQQELLMLREKNDIALGLKPKKRK